MLGKISDAQATLLNQVAAKPISLEDKSDEDIKMIGVSSIDSLFSKVKSDEKGTGEESTLGRRRPNISEGENLVEKIDESGFGEVKTLASDVPTLLDYKDFNYDSCSLIDCIPLLQSKINSPHAYEQIKLFTKYIVDAMMKALEEKLELEVSIPRKNCMMSGNLLSKSRLKIMSVLLCVTWVLVFLRFRNLYVMCLVLPILKNGLLICTWRILLLKSLW